jgi:hypothetical protein
VHLPNTKTCNSRRTQMKPMSDKYGANTQGAQRDTEAITTALFPDTRSGMGGFELLMDLHGVYSMFGQVLHCASLNYTNTYCAAIA